MQIKRHQLRELQYLQEDIAEYFTDENMVSGETYWTCIESIAIAKLAELRGEPLYYEKLKEILDAMITSEDCLLYTSPSPRDWTISRMPSSA